MDGVTRERRRPSRDVLSGESADVYFRRAEEILAGEGMDPVVVMEVFSRAEGILCGIDEAKVLLASVFAESDEEYVVESMADGDTFSS
jgi:nicotinic acid phosphoribosyltransferase